MSPPLNRSLLSKSVNHYFLTQQTFRIGHGIGPINLLLNLQISHQLSYNNTNRKGNDAVYTLWHSAVRNTFAVILLSVFTALPMPFLLTLGAVVLRRTDKALVVLAHHHFTLICVLWNCSMKVLLLELSVFKFPSALLFLRIKILTSLSCVDLILNMATTWHWTYTNSKQTVLYRYEAVPNISSN